MWSVTITTVAVSKTQIACDRQATHSSGFKFKVKTKLFEIENPYIYPTKFIVGYAGDLDAVPDFLSFLMDVTGVTKVPRVKTVEFVALTEDKKIYTFVNPTKWILVDEPYYAIGSGMQYALGALGTGHTPEEAVKAASKMDPHSGLGVKVMEFT